MVYLGACIMHIWDERALRTSSTGTKHMDCCSAFTAMLLMLDWMRRHHLYGECIPLKIMPLALWKGAPVNCWFQAKMQILRKLFPVASYDIQDISIILHP